MSIDAGFFYRELLAKNFQYDRGKFWNDNIVVYETADAIIVRPLPSFLPPVVLLNDAVETKHVLGLIASYTDIINYVESKGKTRLATGIIDDNEKT